MLVLGRREDECIRIGDDVVIRVLEIKIDGDGRRVAKLGIDAPPHVIVHREEVYQAIQKAKAEDFEE